MANGQSGVELWIWAAKKREGMVGGDGHKEHKWNVYRPTIRGLGHKAADYARLWSGLPVVIKVGTPKPAEVLERRGLGDATTLDAQRNVNYRTYQGLRIWDDRRFAVNMEIEDRKDAPPFTYDAFCRALKWALRADKPMTKGGTTCCAFVIACYQAAGLAIAAEPLDLLGTFEKFKLHRNKKQQVFANNDLRLLDKGEQKNWKYVSPRASSKYSNPGFKGSEKFKPEAVDEFIMECVYELTRGKEKCVQNLLSEAMCVDAQFTHSMKLFRRLKEIKAGWDPIAEDQLITT
jgi:hypothetical protein